MRSWRLRRVDGTSRARPLSTDSRKTAITSGSVAPIGLRAQLALQLYNDEGAIGGLNLYSTRSPTVEPDAVRVAELFASHAAIALGRARREEQLNDALVTRKVIGQAIGLTMEHYQITEDRAFLFLVRASQTSNVKLRDVAQNVVDMANDRFAPRD